MKDGGLPGMIKILVADDHPIVRAGLKQILMDTDDMTVSGEAASGHEVMERVLAEDYDVILLDISMPGRGGIDVLKELRNVKPELGVLVLSTHPEEQYGVRVLKAGASGYLTKESASESLLEAVRKVARGEKYITPTLAEKLVVAVAKGKDGPPHERLSDREFQVLCMIASGKTVKDISGELSLSVKTVSTFRSRILEKMNLSNNAEMTHYALSNGLLA